MDFSQCKPGRMSYNHSAVPLWDRTTNELASFATEFTFKIVLSDYNNKSKGAGLNFSGNEAMKASITFDNITMMLVASLHFLNSSSALVSAKLPDPRTLLPPEVAVGFSASTGAAFELHQILSWSFDSTLAAPPNIIPNPIPSLL
uniref:Legume lectin domain-containing protein n=1 Tax=Oryza barthii TaxID=65489 RepID=A0A0D3FSA0_9ORYZ